MDSAKPTLKTPTKSGKAIDKNFSKYINEIDGSLTEEEKKQKETLFNLSKMEYLVHNDPDLSEIYHDMVEDKKDMYGYHYNEAIMNIIFNTKVLKNKKYLKRYKEAPAKKKKRRDKYGVEDLKTPATKKREEKEKDKEETNETTSSGSSGQYATAHAWSDGGQPKMRKPIWNGGTIIQESNYLTNPTIFKDMLNFINENYESTESVNEHHLDDKEEKVAFIIKHKGDEYGGLEELDSKSDEEIDNIYNEVEKEIGLVDESNEVINEIEDSTFFSAIEKMADKNQDSRKKDLVNTYFRDFIGKPIMDSTIREFDADYSHDYLGIDIILNDGEVIKYSLNMKNNQDQYSLPLDPNTRKEKEISRKDNRILSAIAKKVTPKTKYTPGTGDTTISDYSNINEHHLDTRQEKIDFIIKNSGDKYGNESELNNMNDNSINAIYLNLEKELGIDDIDPEDLDDLEVPEFADKDTIDVDKLEDESMDNISEEVSDMYIEFEGDMKGEPEFNIEGKRFKYVWGRYPDNKKDIAVYSYDEDVVYNFEWFKKNMLNENSVLDPLPDTMGMSNDREDSMKLSKANPTSQIQGMNEIMEELKKDLEFLDSISENRRPSALVQLDRLKQQNQSNFKSEVNKVDDIEMAKDQYTDVDYEDSKKMSQEIEQESIKKTDGEALKNVGNSTNDKGDEIPKRNITDEESDDIDMIRDGMHTIAYDNKTDDRFEERMKDGMGDDLYDIRQKKMKVKSEEPMYNKDTQPVGIGDNKKQYNKYMENIKESMIIGKYKNDFGKNMFVNFKFANIQLKESVDLDQYKQLNIDGMGNFYTNKIKIDEDAVSNLKNKNYFINEETNEIIMIEKTKQNINESKSDSNFNGGIDKMKKLLNYDSSKFMDTTRSKNAIKY